MISIIDLSHVTCLRMLVAKSKTEQKTAQESILYILHFLGLEAIFWMEKAITSSLSPAI